MISHLIGLVSLTLVEMRTHMSSRMMDDLTTNWPFGGAWLSERLRRWFNKPDVVGSIHVTTEFFFISCDSNQVPKWFGTYNNLEVPL